MKIKPILLFIACFTPTFGYAATLAFDSAASPVYRVYGKEWWQGSNGGYGWGSGWNIGGSGGVTFAVENAFTIQAEAGASATARRSFDGPLLIGQTFSFDYFSGSLASGSVAGIRIENSASVLFDFSYRGGSTLYHLGDGSSSGGWKFAPVTDQGVHLEFTLTSTSTYSITINQIGSSVTSTYSANLFSVYTEGGPTHFTLYLNNSGESASLSQQSFNNFAVVPEPSSIALVGLAVIGLLKLRRR